MADNPTPGWYPDPSGQPDKLRHWDGQRWGSELRDAGPTSRQAVAPASRTRGPVAPLLVALAVLLSAALVVGLWRPWARPDAQQTDSSSPTVSAWDERAPSTPPPTPGGRETSVPCPRTGGSVGERREGTRLVGAGLSIESRGWTPSGLVMPFIWDSSSESRIIATDWYSTVAVGGLVRDDWSTDLAMTARQVLQCYATSDYFTQGRLTMKTSEAMEVSGRPAHKVTGEVRIDSIPGVEGDVVTVVIVNTADENHYGVFLSAATIGDEQNQLEVADSLSTLRVQG